MALRIIAFALFAIPLFACTPMPKQWPEETFGSPGGYVKTLKIAPPPDICDPDAYINGYRHGYMLSWNQEIKKILDMYGSTLRQNPQDAKAKADSEFYMGKLFDLGNVDQEENRYGFVPSTPDCEFRSNNFGRRQGTIDSVRDVGALKPPAR